VTRRVCRQVPSFTVKLWGTIGRLDGRLYLKILTISMTLKSLKRTRPVTGRACPAENADQGFGRKTYGSRMIFNVAKNL
jgi:hypothetical protein